jgi:two-component system, LytTR family, response regulator
MRPHTHSGRISARAGNGSGMKIRTMIADDEPLARELLSSLLGDDPDIEIIGTCDDGLSAIAMIERRTPDLAFIDVRMPGLNGIKVVEEIDCEDIPHIVFVTAFDEYAVKAFELEAIDYLLKPVERARLKSCVARAKRIIAAGRQVWTSGNTAMRQVASHALEPYVELRKGASTRAVRHSEIIWIEAANQYVRVHTADTSYVHSDSIGQFMQRISAEHFIRVHRSAVINCHHLLDVVQQPSRHYSIVLTGDVRVPLSRRNRKLIPYLWSLACQP